MPQANNGKCTKPRSAETEKNGVNAPGSWQIDFSFAVRRPRAHKARFRATVDPCFSDADRSLSAAQRKFKGDLRVLHRVEGLIAGRVFSVACDLHVAALPETACATFSCA
jgi:hypothetical protein